MRPLLVAVFALFLTLSLAQNPHWPQVGSAFHGFETDQDVRGIMYLRVWFPGVGHVDAGAVPTRIIIDSAGQRFAANSTTSYQITTAEGTWSGFPNPANPSSGMVCFFDDVATYDYEVLMHQRLDMIATWPGPRRFEYGHLSEDAGAGRSGLGQRWYLGPDGEILEWSWDLDYIHAVGTPPTGAAIKGRMVFPPDINPDPFARPADIETHFVLPTECLGAKAACEAGFCYYDVVEYSKRQASTWTSGQLVTIGSGRGSATVRVP